MHQTTVRFSVDLWEAVEAEARRLGISVAQYVREAALARLMYAAGQRRDPSVEEALSSATGTDGHAASGGREVPPRATRDQRAETLDAAHENAEDQIESSMALWAQSKRARERARELREDAANRPRRAAPEKAPAFRKSGGG